MDVEASGRAAISILQDLAVRLFSQRVQPAESKAANQTLPALGQAQLLQSGSSLGPGGRDGWGISPGLLLLSQSCIVLPIPWHLEQRKKKFLYASYGMAGTCWAHWNGVRSSSDCMKSLMLFIMVFNSCNAVPFKGVYKLEWVFINWIGGSTNWGT